MYAIRSYYATPGFPVTYILYPLCVIPRPKSVITSYSIHYTKLYDTPEGYAKTLSDLINEYKPDIVITGNSAVGQDYFPRAAASVNAGLTLDASDLDLTGDNRLIVKRTKYSNKSIATVEFLDNKPMMTTLRPNVFKPEEDTKSPEVVNATVSLSRITSYNVCYTKLLRR